MYRRRLLAGVSGLAGLSGLAGCSFLGSTREVPQTSENRVRTVEPYTEPSVEFTDDDADMPTETDATRRECLPRDVHVHNTADYDQYVTVALDASDGASVVRSTAVSAGETVTHSDVAPGPGRYQVTVDTADGQVGGGEFVVSHGTSDLAVVAGGDGIRTRQRATGWPDCPLVSTAGTAADPPDFPEAIRWYGQQTLVVDNVAPESTTARVRAVARDTGGADALLDYGYRLAAGMRLVLPLVPRAGTYDVTVSTSGADHTRRWNVESDPTMAYTVGDGVTSSTGPPTRNAPPPPTVDSQLHHLANGDNRPHAVTLTVRRAGRLVVADRYNLGIGESVELKLPLPVGDDAELAVSTGDGAETTLTWRECPPMGTVVVAIDDRGEFRVYSDREGMLTE